MKLYDALWCAECEELVDRKETACPSCTGTILFPLSEWLAPLKGREEIELVHIIGRLAE